MKNIFSVCSSDKLFANVLQLGDVAVFQDQAITNIDKTLNKLRGFGKMP